MNNALPVVLLVFGVVSLSQAVHGIMNPAKVVPYVPAQAIEGQPVEFRHLEVSDTFHFVGGTETYRKADQTRYRADGGPLLLLQPLTTVVKGVAAP